MGSLILSRALVIALACACAAALTQLSAAGDDNDCALYLNGPGRTSAYDYSLNLLKGNFAYEGQHTCITYEAINQAYLEARNRIVVSQPKGDWKAEDFASAGELILDISINLARRYGLTYEEIEKGLPLIDTSRTLIRDVCPPVFSHVECRAGKYRRLDGLCNNLQQPTWGSTMAPFQRLLGPLFADGINAPRISHSGRDLPLSRVVSRTMHPDDGYHDHAGTVMVIAWGQFMDHDYTLTGTPLDPINRNDPEECCKRPPHLKHPYCNEIRIPDDDRFYGLWNVKCIDFVRAFPSPRPGCRLGSRVPFNTLTGVIDGNTVYGVTDKFSRKLRTGFGGLLRMNPVFNEYGLKDLLPLKLDIPDEGCTRPSKDMFCFEAGEIRVNEQLVLTVMHTLMAREHNRIAKALAHVNPHWDDETLFQETRRINIAEIQHITYNEFLPILLGKDVMEKFGLVLEKEGYWDGYDQQVNPDVIDAFASAAFRFGHSLLPTAVERWSKAHKFIASKRLSNLIRRPFDLYRAGVLDEYVMGLMNQVAQAMDDSITQEVTNHLFKKVGARFGMDLVSFNMQRGREFGIPGYMEYRKFCGLNGAETFQDLFGSMPNETVRKYESIFEHPIDVDLWSGGVSERPLPGSMLGPTFACVIATQFSYSRRGDRFWYELPNQPSSFTPEQLAEVRKARLARVICDNTDIIDTVQLYPMVLPDHELNPRVPCRSGILPSIDFSKWAEPAPFHGPKPFVTEASIPIINKTESVNHTDTAVNSQEHDVKTKEGDSSILTPVLKSCNGTTNQNCTKNMNCTECLTKLKESQGTDTVLKYVYKKDDKVVNFSKSSSHPKNSLRRKRSNYDGIRYAASAPVIVNYQTTHGHPIRPTFQRLTNGIIKNAALADFNIETLHDSQPNQNNEKIKSTNQYVDDERSVKNEGNHKNVQHFRENENSAEEEDSSSRERIQSNESEDSADSGNESNERYRKEYKSGDRRQEKEERNSAEEEEDQSKESYKEEDSKERNLYPIKKVPNTSDSSEENNNDPRKISQYRESKYNEEKKEYRNNPHDSRESLVSDKKTNNLYPESRERDYESHNFKNKSPYRGLEHSEGKKHYRTNEPGRNRQADRIYLESNENNNSQQSEENNDVRKEKSDYRPNEPVRKRKTDRIYSESNENNNSQQSEENDDVRKDTTPLKKSKYLASPKDSNEDTERSEESSNHNENNRNDDSREDDSPYDSKLRKESAEIREKGDSVEKILHHDDNPLKSYHRESQNQKNDRLTTNESPESQEEEAIIAIMKRKNKKPVILQSDRVYNREDKSGLNSPIKIQDVDLSDFNNFERIRVNDKGIVEPLSDTHENYENLSAPLIEPLTTLRPDIVQDNDKQSARSSNSAEIPQSSESEEDDGQLVHIDAEEIKPVIEFNAEKDESREENSKEAIKANPNEDTSLETLLGVKEQNSEEKDDKIVAGEEVKNKGDVKQQFERIPLNYDHSKKEQQQNNDDSDNKSNDENPETQKDIPSSNDQGTLDVFTPTIPVKYDEHLNIKFDDVSIRLPDIKLPEDILAYSYDEPFYKKKNKNKNPKNEQFFHYDEQEYDHTKGPVRENIEEEEDHDDHDPSYYNKYYGRDDKKQDYKKDKQHHHEDDDDDEEEDLYEKFVRERFGKRGTFEKRSEKLTAPTLPAVENVKLYHALNKVLKKAANIEKEAKQSGDPNAGYMWTVEYGKPL